MQMLDLERLKRDMHAVPGNVVAATKAQMDTLIDAAAEGQRAIQELAELQRKSGAVLVAA
jgi:hypothetical protein